MIKNGFDLIDLMGPEATREDYEGLLAIVQGCLDELSFGEDDEDDEDDEA